MRVFFFSFFVEVDKLREREREKRKTHSLTLSLPSSSSPNHLPSPSPTGHKQYFVSSDVGDGKMQWYGFHEEPAGGEDAAGGKKERLLSIFGGWTDQVTDLLRATREDDVLRRDIYDRPPIFKW